MSIAEHDFDSFGELLRTFRKQARLTQEQLASAVGMHRHEISRWEQGSVLPASKAIVLDLARHLHLSNQQARQLLDASLTAPTPIWGVPHPRNPLFTGRTSLLQAVHDALDVQREVEHTRVYGLQGLAGVGKTQTALEYAYQHALEYRALFWIDAETLERAQASVQRIAELVQVPERAASEFERVREAVQRWLLTHDHWLLIWDNLEDAEVLHQVLPPTRQGAYLLTTRQQALGTLVRGIDLEPLTAQESLWFLLRRAKRLEPEARLEQVRQFATRAPQEYAAAGELVDELGGLPLALDQAGAYIEETGCRLADYLQRYQQQGARLLDRRGEAGGQHPQSVTTTFRLLYQRIAHQQQAGADLLRICAFLHAEAIPEELFRLGARHLGPTLAPVCEDPTQFDLMLASLRQLSLVQRQAQTHTLSLHRVVQVILREQMDQAEEQLWSERVIRFINAMFPEGDFSSWDQGERYLTQALACVPLIAAWGQDLPEAGELLAKAGHYLLGRRRLDGAQSLLDQAVILGERQFGPEHPVLIPRLTDQVELRLIQNKEVHVQALSSRLLAIERQHLGPAHAKVGETLNNLAVFYLYQGKYEQAEMLFQQALRIREQALGSEHEEVGETLSNLGFLSRCQGKYEQAEQLYKRALHIREQALGSDHPFIGQSFNNLAVVYREQGRYEQAEPLFLQALHLYQQTLGPDHPDVTFALSNLAILYREQGKYEQAESLFQQALHMREQALGPDNPSVARLLYHLAILYQKQGKDEQAETLFQQALHIRKQTLEAAHPDIALSLSHLAALYLKQEKYDQAECLFQQALSLHRQTVGLDHLDAAFTLHGLATVYKEQEKYGQAASLYQQALSIRQRALTPDHPDVRCSLRGLAQVSKEQGHMQPAEALHGWALSRREPQP